MTNPMAMAMMQQGLEDPQTAQMQQMSNYHPLQMQQPPQQGGMQGMMGLASMLQGRKQQQGAQDAAQANQFFSQYGY